MKFSSFLLRQESASLQLYGKLPVAKDYLRIGCGDGAGRALREWLDSTFGTVRDASEALILSEPLRFLGLSEKEPLQGCLWPSSDEGGHRKFPFAVFVARKRKALANDIAEGNLGQAEGVWRLLSETHERCLAAEDGRALLDEHRGKDVDVTGAEQVPGVPADFDTWVAILWPDEGLAGLKSLLEEVAALAGQRHDGPYRLPLARALPLRDQVIAWIDFLREIGALHREDVPTVFFPNRTLVPSHEPAQMVVLGRELRNDEVTWLTASGEEALGTGDFATGKEGADPGDLEEGDDEVSSDDGEDWLRKALGSAWKAFRAEDA